MDQIKVSRIRGGSRALATKLCNDAAALKDGLRDKSPETQTVMLDDLSRSIDRVRASLKELDRRFEDAEDPNLPLTDEEWAEEFSSRDAYARKLDVLQDLHRRLSGSDKVKGEPSEAGASGTVNGQMALLLEQLIKVQQLSANTAALQQLPTVNVRNFGGDCLQFLQFWSEFKSTVHDKESLPAMIKFRHLKQLLTGKAASSIDAIPVSEESYPKAIDYLIRRYGDIQQISIKIFTELLDATQGKEMRLRQLIDQTNNAVSTLESLKISQEYYSLIMYPLLLKAISRSLSLRFISSRGAKVCDAAAAESNGTDDSSSPLLEDIIIPKDLPQLFNQNFKELLVFLTREAQAREEQDQICPQSKDESRHKKGDQPQKPPKQSQSPPKSENSSQVYNLQAPKGKTDKCLICGLEHFTARCEENFSVEQKIQKLEAANACVKCLKLNHKTVECKKDVKCPKCEGEHYSVLCPRKVLANVVQDESSLLPTGHVRVLSNTDSNEVARFLTRTRVLRGHLSRQISCVG